jgi:chromate transporter
MVYARFGQAPALEALFHGLKPAVLAIVLQAVLRLRARALGTAVSTTIAAAAFVAMFALGVPFPYVIAGAALVAVICGRSKSGGASPDPPDAESIRTRHAGSRVAAIAALALWLVPVVVVTRVLAADHVLAQQAVFFSRMAVVTFGGAYAVLTYVAQHAVEVYGWLTPAEMLDGLGLAETTPGPLIQVVQFVGYLAAYRNPAGMDPLVAGVLGSILTTWVTFAPCFFFIFAGAPFLDAVSRWPAAQAALRGITAAVTGVVLNLAVWFSVHTLFAQTRATHAGILDVEWPVWSTIDPGAASIALIATVLTLRFEARMFTVLGFGAGAGILLSLLH